MYLFHYNYITSECLGRFCIRKSAGHSGFDLWNWEKKNVHVVLIASNSFTLFLPHLLNQKNKKLKCFKETFQGCWDRRRPSFLSEFYSLNFTVHIRNIQLCFYLFLGQGHSVLLKLSLLRFCPHYLILSKALVQLSHLWNSWF